MLPKHFINSLKVVLIQFQGRGFKEIPGKASTSAAVLSFVLLHLWPFIWQKPKRGKKILGLVLMSMEDEHKGWSCACVSKLRV
jgi:hypothetical protein